MTVLRSIAGLFALACLALPATAGAGTGPDWDKCQGPSVSDDDRIAGCTAVIAAGKEGGHDLAVAYCNRGLALTEKRQLDEALADLDKAIAADDSYACPYSNRGRIKRFNGDLDGAIVDYDAAIKRDPKFSVAYNNRGDAWMAAGDRDEGD